MKKILTQFQILRKKVNKDCEQETKKRIKTNPKPSEDEIWIGAYKEMLEPQVRDAIFVMNKKGFSTESSGFGGKYGKLQIIDGNFTVAKKSINQLKKIGVKYLDKNDLGMLGLPNTYHSIRFNPKKANLSEIKKTWDYLAKILPDKKLPISPSIGGGSMFFRQMLVPERIDVEKLALEKMLKYESMEPNFYRPAMEYRLKIINKLLKK